MRVSTIGRVAVFQLAAVSSVESQQVDYEISFPNAAQHEARVVATFGGLRPGSTLEVRMSRSSPGRYAITSYAKNVYDVTVVNGRGRELPVARPDPYGWNVRDHDGTVRVTYTVWGDRVDGTYLGIDETHAHMNMPATFMWARGLENAPVRLRIRAREGWKVATQLAPTADPFVFTAPNLQWFLDSPTEAGPVSFRTWTDSASGTRATWRVAIHHLGAEAEVDWFTAMTERIVAETNVIFGGPPRLDLGTYTFIADYLPWASGDGMEHRNSTILSSPAGLGDSVRRAGLLGAVAHEYFHVWNVERLRPRSLEPFNYDGHNMSGDLWFGEGFTNYYDGLILRRSGLMTDSQLAASFESAIAAVVNGPGRGHASAIGMSMMAPFFDGGVSLDPTNRQNTFISYYTWGETIGLALDLTLRARFGTTLDAYMVALWRDFGQHQSRSFAPERSYTHADLRTVLGRVARDDAFAADFFARYIEGREVPDFAGLLAHGGFLVRSTGGDKPYLGASLASDSAGVFVNWTSENGSMYKAGIANGDIVRAVNGIAVRSEDSLGSVIGGMPVGTVVKVDVSQRPGLRRIPMTLVALPTVTVVPYETAGLPITEAIRSFRMNWLGSKARLRDL